MAGQVPSEEWLDRCQQFDDSVRSFDTGVLRKALARAEGRRAMEQLDQRRDRFEAAFEGVREALKNRMNAARRGRSTLQSYRSAGDRQRGGPKFIDRNL
ncbi:MAG: hypothetical protein VX498_06250 [Myxococcota bacterium]|nr:hypothetical protein [Myxococcota bacterium]